LVTVAVAEPFQRRRVRVHVRVDVRNRLRHEVVRNAQSDAGTRDRRERHRAGDVLELCGVAAVAAGTDRVTATVVLACGRARHPGPGERDLCGLPAEDRPRSLNV
jgi:hypothetical protein